MRTFTDPVRHEEWRVIVEFDADGDPHAVFVREVVRLHPPKELFGVEGLTEEDYRRLFPLSHREIWHENEVWRVWWEERENQETWTWFESPSGEKKRVARVMYPFPYVSGATLADALRKAGPVD